MSANEIRAAVEAARARLPNLPSDYADRAIDAGKTVMAVKGELFAQMTTDPRERSKADMLARVARMKGDPAAASASTTGRTSMLAEMKRQGLEPAR